MSIKIIKNKQGVSLVEMLIMSGLLGTVSLGLLKISNVSVRTLKSVNQQQYEKDLKKTVYSFLNSESSCGANLETADSTTGEITKITHDGQDILEEDTEFKNSGITIAKMEFIDPNTTNTDTAERSFILQYKKTGEDKKKVITCKVKYDSSSTPTVCQPLDCFQSKFTDLMCPDNMYLRGIDQDGQKQCAELCPSGKIFIEMTPSGPDCLDVSCRENELIQFYYNNNKLDRRCITLANLSCTEDGQYMYGLKINEDNNNIELLCR